MTLAPGTQVEWAARAFDPGTGTSRTIVRLGEVVGVDATDGSLVVESVPVRYQFLRPDQVSVVASPVPDVPAVAHRRGS